MSDFVQVIIVICVFLAYIITVVAKPSKFKFESKSKVNNEGENVKEVCVTLVNKKED